MSIVKDLLLIAGSLTLVYFVLMYIKQLKQELIKQREYFIKTLSHDLRVSTLAQIRGLDLLQKTGSADKELVSNISDSCKYTFDMITMLLKTYRYENGEAVLNYEKFNFSDVIKLCCCNLEIDAKEKGVDIIVDIEKTFVLDADKCEISKAIMSLISTSIFNSERDKSLLINVKQHYNNLNVSITYIGKPLSKEECDRMFLNNPRFSTVGHGIRMYFCKKIIEFHRGNIKVVSNGDKTNTFTFELPLLRKVTTPKAPILSTLQPYSL